MALPKFPSLLSQRAVISEESEFVSKLFSSREQVHILHLRTSSFAEHKALNDYYDDIVGLVDTLVETWQGRNNTLIGGYKSFNFQDGDCLGYMKGLRTYVDNNRKSMGSESHIQNIIDEIVGLIDQTIYKLTFLK